MAFTAATLGAAACGGDVSAPDGGTSPRSDAVATAGGARATGGAGAAATGGDMPIVFYGAPFPPGGASNAGGTSGAGGKSGTGG